MNDASPPRSFVVTVRSAPPRVVVEDVRRGQQAAAPDVAAAGAQIERWLERPENGPDACERAAHPGERDRLR